MLIKLRSPHIVVLTVIMSLLVLTAIYFGTDKLSDPEVAYVSMDEINKSHARDIIIVNQDSVFSSRNPEEPQTSGDTNGNSRGISGELFGKYPVELFAVSMTGEGGAMSWGTQGDNGKAYGWFQFDYRYSLVAFMQYAYTTYPDVWGELEPYQNIPRKDSRLKSNKGIRDAFIHAKSKNRDVFIAAQCEYAYARYFEPVADKLKAKGINLEDRHIAVSSAVFSFYVFSGSAKKISSFLDNSMTDEEMIRSLYNNASRIKSNAKRRFTDPHCEQQQVLDLYNGNWKVTDPYPKARGWSSGWDLSKLIN